jgi:exopolysaccharide biosynthesis polyprenyl glycosylphosphotransferase
LRRRKLTKHIVEYVFDAVALTAAWYGAVHVRLLLNPFMTRSFTPAEMYASAPPVFAVLLLWLAASLWMAVYRPRKRTGVGEDFARLFEPALIVSTLYVVVTFFSRGFGAAFSRSYVLVSLPVNFTLLLFARYCTVFTIRLIDDIWPSPERIALVGSGHEVRDAIECVRRNSGYSVSLTGVILPERAALAAASGTGGVFTIPGSGSVATLSSSVPLLGSTTRLAELINRKQLDRIIFVNGCATEQEIERCGAISKRMGVVLSRTLDVPQTAVRVEFAQRFGLPLLELTPVAFTRRQERIKRVFDVLASSVTLFVLAPAMLLIAILIKVTSEGPVLFKSPRVGRGGRYFTFLKFRSMRINGVRREELKRSGAANGHLFKLKNDPRITPLGRILRKYSLDELPQLLNVLRGEMSLVGPRPLPAEDLDPDGQSSEFEAWSEQRSRVLPGITGLWQIRGRSDVSFDEMVQLDVDYIRDWSLMLDLRILLETPLVVATGRGAY